MTILSSSLGLWLALAPADAGVAKAPEPAAPMRKAEQVLADYAAAIGGPQPFRKHKSVYVKRERTVKGMGLTGTEERWATSDGKTLQVLTLPGIGSFKQGHDGKTAWSSDPINGLRKLTGAEGEEARLEAIWDAEVRLAKIYAKVRSVPAPADVKGAVECVEMSPKIGPPTTACFDAISHLRVAQVGKQASPQGEVPFFATFGDWREVEGLKMPYTEGLSAGAINTEGRVLEVRVDTKIAPATFKVPTSADAPVPKP